MIADHLSVVVDESRDGTWLLIHDSLREWVRIENQRQKSPSEAIIDSQSVKSAAGVHQEVGFDGGKLLKGRKRFLTVDTLGKVTAGTSHNCQCRGTGRRQTSAKTSQTHEQSSISVDDSLG